MRKNSYILIVSDADADAINEVISTDDWYENYSVLVENVIVFGPTYLNTNTFIRYPMTRQLRRFFKRLATRYRDDLYAMVEGGKIDDTDEWKLEGWNVIVEQYVTEQSSILKDILEDPMYCVRLEKVNRKESFVDWYDMSEFA